MSVVKVPIGSSKLLQGRSGVSGITATIFGSTGFLGKYVVNKFGQIGCRCILPHRGDDIDVRHLKLAGDLGAIAPVEMSIRNLDEITAMVADSNVVINLLGKHFETMRWSFTDLNTTFPAVLAQVPTRWPDGRAKHLRGWALCRRAAAAPVIAGWQALSPRKCAR